MPELQRLLRHGALLNKISALPGAWELGARLKDLRAERPIRRELARLAGDVARQAPPPAEAGGRILVVSPHSWKFPLLVEVTTALAMRLRGARVTVLACDGGVPHCDNRTVSFDPAGLCRVCWGRARRTLKAAGLDTLRISELAASPELDAALAEIDRTPDDALAGVAIDGTSLWDVATTSYWRSMLAKGMTRGEIDRAAQRGFLRATARAWIAVRAAIARVEPTAILGLNGTFHVQAAALRQARAHGIPFVNYEGGVVTSGTIHVHVDRAAADFDFGAAWAERAERPLADEQRERIDEFLLRRRTGAGNPFRYLDRPKGRGDEILAARGLDPSRPTMVAFTNVLWDSAVIDKDVAFAGITDWIRTFMAALRESPERQAVFRIHPAELRVPRRQSIESLRDLILAEGAGAMPNVAVIGPEEETDSYALMDVAESVHVYTTTAGLEAAAFGRPVVVAGGAHYAGKGFTFDLASREQLATIVAGRLRPGADDETVRLARRYAHFYFFEQMGSVPATEVATEYGTTTGELRAKTAGDLRPGHFPGLDALCDALGGR